MLKLNQEIKKFNQKFYGTMKFDINKKGSLCFYYDNKKKFTVNKKASKTFKNKYLLNMSVSGVQDAYLVYMNLIINILKIYGEES